MPKLLLMSPTYILIETGCCLQRSSVISDIADNEATYSNGNGEIVIRRILAETTYSITDLVEAGSIRSRVFSSQ